MESVLNYVDGSFFDGRDYREKCKLGETDLIGVYVPANHEHPSYSSPIPGYVFSYNPIFTVQILKYFCE